MGQNVYVLTTSMTSKDKEGKKVKEWRPVGVVTSAQHADEWVSQSDNNDWIPFELDDMSLVTGEHSVAPFQPKKPLPVDDLTEKAFNNMQAVNDQLVDILEQLAAKYKEKEILKLVGNLKTQALRPSGKTSASSLKSSLFDSELLRKRNG